jgi:hypothetical protein
MTAVAANPRALLAEDVVTTVTPQGWPDMAAVNRSTGQW